MIQLASRSVLLNLEQRYVEKYASLSDSCISLRLDTPESENEIAQVSLFLCRVEVDRTSRYRDDAWPVEDPLTREEPEAPQEDDSNDDNHEGPHGPDLRASRSDNLSMDRARVAAGARYFETDYEPGTASARFIDAIATGLERSNLEPEALSGVDRRGLKEAAYELAELSSEARESLRHAYAVRAQAGVEALEVAVSVAEGADDEDEELRTASSSLAKMLRRMEDPVVQFVLDAWMK